MRLFPLAIWTFLTLAHSLEGQAPRDVVVGSYNVQNYHGAELSQIPRDGLPGRATPKPEKSIAELLNVIREMNADILGVCEMGRPEAFEDFKKRLQAAGLGYTDFEYVAAADEDRHLALVSRFPIVARNSVSDAGYELNGIPQKVKRGFLDVTVRVNPEYDLRLVGVHLKSKLPVPEGEALVRRHEAQLLRRHLDGILKADPETNLIAYGDFNDSKNEPAILEVMGTRGSDTYMADLWAKDSMGDRWTYYWRTADSYTRIDYLFVSPALFPEVLKEKSTVYRSPVWQQASDHRAVYGSITPQNRARR